MRVHQILSGAGPQDAITAEARHFRTLLKGWGLAGGDFAARIDPRVSAYIAPLHQLRSAPEDLLLFHHSAAFPRLQDLLALPSRKLLLYHNVTPPRWLWDDAPSVAVHCALGREQLLPLVRSADALAADSAFNASELRAAGGGEVTVVPLPVDPARLGPPGAEPQGPPTLLFVGRLSPHKRQEELIRTFSAYRRERAPQARLMLVGDPVTAEYVDRLAALAEQLAPGAVTIESGLSQSELADRYRAAHVMVCLSAHEGFCVPLVEAMHFGVPVVARPAGAVAEVLGDAGILVDDDDPAVLCELVHLVVGDAELRDELRRRGRRRLEQLSPALTTERLRIALAAAAGNGAFP